LFATVAVISTPNGLYGKLHLHAKSSSIAAIVSSAFPLRRLFTKIKVSGLGCKGVRKESEMTIDAFFGF